jgi:aryl-alcohol dehydrogenase-like predicted oxidoreductase
MPSVARTINLGDIEVPRMGLGTNRLTETAANVEFIRSVSGTGVGLVDTAHLYTGGSSEATIGAALPGTHQGLIVATKGGFRPGEGKRDVLSAQIEESLRKLQTDSIDLYYLHRIDPETPFEETASVLAAFHEAGKIRRVGISHVSIAQIEKARRIVPISAVQNQYNLADHGCDDVVDYCLAQGIVFVPYYPLHGEHPRLLDIARSHGATPTQIKLAWLLRRSPNILPIPGTLDLDHVRENVAALELELTDEEFAALA